MSDEKKVDLSSEERPVRILFIDKDTKLAAKIKGAHKQAKEANPDGTHPRPIFSETVRESQSYLSNREYAYAGVFVNPAIGTPAWVAVVKAAHQFRAGVPVYVIYDEQPKLNPKEVKALGLQGFLKKPLEYADILKLVLEEDTTAVESAPPAAEPAVEEKDTPEPVNDADFMSVDLSNVVGSMSSLFDLFIKVSNGKYLKVCRSGEILSKQRVEGYKSKGAKELYISKVAQEAFMEFCDKMTAELLKDTNVSMDVKTSQVASQGESVMSFLKNSGFSEKSLEAAQQYVANTTEIVTQIAAKNESVKNLLDDVRNREHGVACATLASLLIKHIGGQNPTVISAVGIACFMHDAALLGQPPHVYEEQMDKMTEDEKKLFYLHPEAGSKLVKKIKSIPAAVEQAVLEHHLRLNKGGFPKEKAVNLPNRLGELIGISEEFLKLLKMAEADTGLNPYASLMNRAGQEFSEPIVKAFVKAFQDK